MSFLGWDSAVGTGTLSVADGLATISSGASNTTAVRRSFFLGPGQELLVRALCKKVSGTCRIVITNNLFATRRADVEIQNEDYAWVEARAVCPWNVHGVASFTVFVGVFFVDTGEMKTFEPQIWIDGKLVSNPIASISYVGRSQRVFVPLPKLEAGERWVVPIDQAEAVMLQTFDVTVAGRRIAASAHNFFARKLFMQTHISDAITAGASGNFLGHHSVTGEISFEAVGSGNVYNLLIEYPAALSTGVDYGFLMIDGINSFHVLEPSVESIGSP